MKHLVSMPPNAVESFHRLSHVADYSDWFAASDPEGSRLGSGGGTAWILYKAYLKDTASKAQDFIQWLKYEKRIIIHAGGQSRRLPGYAALGKLLLPVPVFRWSRGQRLDQSLLDVQLPLLHQLLEASSACTLIASGDALIYADQLPRTIPQADVVVVGLSVDPSIATRHGVFVCPRADTSILHAMLQKPSIGDLQALSEEHLFLIDSGIWLLSDRAIRVLSSKCGLDSAKESFPDGLPRGYDLYGTFGLALGNQPTLDDPDIQELTSAVLYLPQAAFYHFGSSPELVSSSLALQNRVSDQLAIQTRSVKPHPAMFVQNAVVDIKLETHHAPLWIENAHIGKDWTLSGKHVITGIPKNNWNLSLPSGLCLEVLPVSEQGKKQYAIRPYGWSDSFSGLPFDSGTQWMGMTLTSWFENHGLDARNCIDPDCSDIQQASLFPVMTDLSVDAAFIQWLIDPEPMPDPLFSAFYADGLRMSASQLSSQADLGAMEDQRLTFRRASWQALSQNYRRSVFYQIDLSHASTEWLEAGLPILPALPDEAPPILKLHNNIFRHRLGVPGAKDQAYEVLRETILKPIRLDTVNPVRSVLSDQIVWSRSPVRIDLAGGWTDTPPYCLVEGGRVVNVALELNGQPPLQVFIKPCENRHILLRSIDLGEQLVVTEYSQLATCSSVGTAFAVPVAALSLCGFNPDFSGYQFSNLGKQLEAFGSGLEMTFMAAVPKGSGMGTSSILAATILGALSDFCSLDWNFSEISRRTLALEQLLTSGGGWQDQCGGMYTGVKLLESEPAMLQSPQVRWLPDRLFSQAETRACMLLYYTGVTRVAKSILVEIVEGMFLNQRDKLAILKDIKAHASVCADAIQHGSYNELGKSVARSWNLNKLLDPDTTNPEIERLVSIIEPYAIGWKLPGAGGGGYMYILAKDPEAAARLKQTLNRNPLNDRARFVDMKLSDQGMQVSRS